MNYRITARRALSQTLAFIFLLSSFVPAFAQHRRRAQRTTATTASTQRAIQHQPLEGTKHVRPPRTFDVLNYTIRTRFDVPNHVVIGDETGTLKPLAGGFKSFDLDAS